MGEALIVFNENFIRAELELLLRKAGIDLSKWGVGSTKTIDHLVKEIKEKEARFFVNDRGELVREIIVAALIVTYTDETGTYILQESRQDFKNGSSRVREWDSSLSEKAILGEEPLDAFRRALYQELPQIQYIKDPYGIALGPEWVNSLDINYMGPPEFKTHYSSSYPGLITDRIVHNATVKLSKEHFIPEGYCEVQDGLTTYFTWQKVE